MSKSAQELNFLQPETLSEITYHENSFQSIEKKIVETDLMAELSFEKQVEIECEKVLSHLD